MLGRWCLAYCATHLLVLWPVPAQSNATIEARVGGRFTWFGGSVQVRDTRKRSTICSLWCSTLSYAMPGTTFSNCWLVTAGHIMPPGIHHCFGVAHPHVCIHTFSWCQGEFTELEPGKKISMNWRFSSWEDGVLSKVCVLSLSSSCVGVAFQMVRAPAAVMQAGMECGCDRQRRGFLPYTVLRPAAFPFRF